MRLRQLLKSKLHHARVTYANPNYVGSIEVDADLLRAVDIVDGEMVHIWAVDHTARVETYAFSGPKGVVGINGGAAHLFHPGDRIIIAAFSITDETIVPKIVLLGEDNAIVKDMTPFTVHG